MKSNSPTIRDVAALAGVSHQTVSRVINGHHRVTKETRQKVLDAIETLGYIPNAVARSMVHGKTQMLAFFAPDLIDFTHASILHAAETEARRRGYFLLGSTAPDKDSLTQLIAPLVQQRRVDGIVALNPDINQAFEVIPENAFTTYICGRPSSNLEQNCVYFDNQQGAFDAVQHLISLDHKKIATITGPIQQISAEFRQQGYVSAMEKAGLEINSDWIAAGDWSATSGYQVFKQWANNEDLPTAVFSQNDRMAIGIIRAARDLGIRVPEDLSIIGFDDMPLASYFDPSLTTMKQDMAAIGRTAIDLLVNTIQNGKKENENICFRAELVVRNSTSLYTGR